MVMDPRVFGDTIRGGQLLVGTPKVKDFTINLIVECPCERPAPVMLFAGCVGAAVMCPNCKRFHVLRGFQYFPEKNAVGWQLETVVAVAKGAGAAGDRVPLTGGSPDAK